MTRFLYIADTHLGTERMGYQQQKAYPEQLPQIIAALGDYISSGESIDFVLHGGDMIDQTTDDNILAAAEAFDLSAPVYLCLGNHDLTLPDAAERWLELAPQFFINGAPDYTITSEDCMIHVAPNQWCDEPLYWSNSQEPHFTAAQADRLSRDLLASPDLPHFVLTHSPVHGLPVEQTGLASPHHSPSPSFTEEITAIAARNSCLHCVLGAHNHMNMRVTHEGTEFVTVSAFVEAPFEFKLFEITQQRIEMSTISVSSELGFEIDYDESKSFVQGRTCDRSISKDL